MRSMDDLPEVVEQEAEKVRQNLVTLFDRYRDAGWTIKAVGEAVRTETTAHSWKRGTTRMNFESLVKVAWLYSLKPGDLFREPEDFKDFLETHHPKPIVHGFGNGQTHTSSYAYVKPVLPVPLISHAPVP